MVKWVRYAKHGSCFVAITAANVCLFLVCIYFNFFLVSLWLILNAFKIIFHRFATLATRMEQYIQGQSRDLVDQAYTKFVSDSFKTLSCVYDVLVRILCL
jgi:hypothetical protein